MSDYPLPPIAPNSSELQLLDNIEPSRSIFTGATKRTDRTGERLLLSLSWRSLESTERNRLQSAIAQLNVRQHRLIARDFSYTKPTGTLSSIGEMLDVAFNTWIPEVSEPLRATSRPLYEGIRLTGGQTGSAIPITPVGGADGISAPTVGLCYAGKLKVGTPRPGFNNNIAKATFRWRQGNWGTVIASGVAIDEAGTVILPTTCFSASNMYPRPEFKSNAAVETRGMTQDFYSLSVARCLMVDNGNNRLFQSEDFSNATWVKTRATVSADAIAAPDGQTTGDELIEDSTASATHLCAQLRTRTSVEEFWTGSVFLKKNTSQRIRLEVEDGAGNSAYAVFDADTGTITESITEVGAAAWAQASIHDYGDGWYRCRVTAYMPASTNIRMEIYLCDGATNTITFNGDGTSGLYLWGADMKQTDQLGHYVATAGAAVSGTEQTGSEIWVKGLDAGIAGQLLAGDQIEVNGQLCVLQADLDGDPDGCGVAVVSPRIRSAPADDTPVILYQPEGRFFLAEESAGWNNRPGRVTAFSDIVLNLEEDIAQ